MLTKNTNVDFKTDIERALSLMIFSLDSPKGYDNWLSSHIIRIILVILGHGCLCFESLCIAFIVLFFCTTIPPGSGWVVFLLLRFSVTTFISYFFSLEDELGILLTPVTNTDTVNMKSYELQVSCVCTGR